MQKKVQSNMIWFKLPLGGIMFRHILMLFLVSSWTCCESVTEGRYRCTLQNFIRLGNSCYYLSTEIATWQESHFRCRDKNAQLAVLASQYEDATLRSYLERPEFAQIGRWIGGIWATKWIWAAQGAVIENPSSFASSEAFNLQDRDQWTCLFLDPNNKYRWNGQNCMRQLHYICEAPLAKASNSTGEDTTPSTPSLPVSPPVLSSPSDSKFTINPASEDTSSSFTTTPGSYEDAEQSPSNSMSASSEEEE